MDRNLAAATRLMAAAAADGVRRLALPASFCLLGRNDRDKLAIAEALSDGPIQAHLAAAARRLGLWLIGAPCRCAWPVPVPTPTPTPTPTPCGCSTAAWSPAGQRVARHDKIHLFAFDNGGERYDAGRVLQAGVGPLAVDTEGWRIGLSICYDLRFSEL